MKRACQSDRESQRLRNVAFFAFESWCAANPVPSAQATKWQRLISDKKEELQNTATWLAERREARRREAAEEEEARRRTRKELVAAQAQRMGEEQAFAEARARLEEARRRVEQLARAMSDPADLPQRHQPGTARSVAEPPRRGAQVPKPGQPSAQEATQIRLLYSVG